ncbi:glutamine--fructose-6-phosphate transaminase (isomerizing) [Helicobacter trogontum]|uniref:Glutamine--fructose-6-phosphate aminotransferase [isomerizing] n=1 Tax=Helicobacter trogontum TaxID=50960 RepID=A0A4U8THL1_9HELI|nr:glutamine--fructose-6-phosphate transaminase (isomerizing) [Helicobacter trogontum]MCI5786589.1 glutamine--fructose-6-phosphate transaminase (isomerizing) [Helicobacter trogontum]MDY5184494.1 glutamine--fructose-6-phosphate transaminase (isomerizing) [Helicobacter trogontum]TLD99731.1 glutamine--fructose-6-phosphate transaminase (isomerizing) [Helicobacter trogontum]
MCGIVGYIGNKDKKNVILNGLKELEYRGYDSAGMAVLQNENLETFRAVGKLENLNEKLQDIKFEGYGLAIGHTRWATHGKPTESNAHPHSGLQSAIIHNGIIENYKELREELQAKSIQFQSQTDTEAIVHLFESYAQMLSPKEAFEATIKRLQGSFAILLITKLESNRIFYAKKHSPLLIGFNKNSPDEVFFASSDAALVGLIDSVIYLDDGAYGSLSINEIPTLSYDVKPFNVSREKAQKGNYRYFMEKEIYEQESILLETMVGRVSQGSVCLDELDSNFFNAFKSIAICACGTSYHSALVGKYLLERKARVRTTTHIASEFRYAKPVLESDELFIAISQSGETADTLQALKLAKEKGLKTLVICNVDNSSMVRLADYCLLTRAGTEKGVASTKAFATQVMVLWIFSVLLGHKRGCIDSIGLENETRAMLHARSATHINQNLHEKIKRLSKRYLHGHGFFFIGRDIFYPLALEGALKLKEISYLHAEGYPSGEMKHGPIALADSELFTLALMPKNLLYEKNKSNVEELIARDSTICAISPIDFELADDIVKIPQFESYMEEFFSMMVVLQLLALEIAVRLNNDVDMPRNLAKSVTVE